MTTKTELTLEEFWALPPGETAYELVDGQAIPKVSPKYFHSCLQAAILVLIRSWCKGKVRVGPEWAVTLKRNGETGAVGEVGPVRGFPPLKEPTVGFPDIKQPANPEGKDWVPTPDLTYISYNRLPQNWRRNEACPVPCDLAIEIISPDQTREELAKKAQDYLNAGVLRVVVVDPEAIDITTFSLDGTPTQYQGDTKIVDALLPGLELSPQLIFEEAELV